MSLKRKNRELTEAMNMQRCLKCFKSGEEYVYSSAFLNEEEVSQHFYENYLESEEEDPVDEQQEEWADLFNWFKLLSI